MTVSKKKPEGRKSLILEAKCIVKNGRVRESEEEEEQSLKAIQQYLYCVRIDFEKL